MSTVNWTKRIASYEAGAPIPKALIIKAASQIRMNGPHAEVLEAGMAYPLTGGLTWAITPAHAAQGLTWIRTPRIYRQLDPKHQATVDAFDHFTFSGFLVEPRGFGFNAVHIVYRVHAENGAWFDYVYYGGPFRGGNGGVEVVAYGGAK